MPLKVIGAGLSRTGTLSLKLALEQLGFGPCFHMDEFIRPEYESRRAMWDRATEGDEVDWETMLSGYASAVDMPACVFYRKLAQAYPQAKIVLTTRDAASWYRSSLATVWAGMPSGQTATPARSERAEKMRAANIREVGFHILENPRDERLTISLFERYTAQVQSEFPPERLLTFDVEQGWAPLCRFLDAPIPSAAFPSQNATAEFGTRFGPTPRPS